MEKEELKKDKISEELEDHNKSSLKDENKKEEISPEDKIKELEDKVTRTFAEMENQRRRFEKEKDDAFEYGGFSFAKDCLLYTSPSPRDS